MEQDRTKKSSFSVDLPQTNENGCYEIRLESIGGLGANLCGKLLGELGAVYLGLNAAAFSSYGSEKRGSPVKSYVRWSLPDRDILHNSPIEHPHILVLFHYALNKTFQVTAGAKEDCTVIVNTGFSPEQVRKELKLCAGKVCCIDALNLALQCKSRINMVMLGAITKASGFIPLEAVKELISNTLGKKYPLTLDKNLEGLELGYNSVHILNCKPDKQYKEIPYKQIHSKWGYLNAPLGGANPNYGSTVSNDISSSRQGFIPLFLPEKCIHCGLCDTACPDMVFQFLPGKYRGKPSMINRGLDYHHCKGCLRCVDVCPTEALVAGKENEHPDKNHFMRNKDLITEHLDFDSSGADPWITGESFSTEKRVDGGII